MLSQVILVMRLVFGKESKSLSEVVLSEAGFKRVEGNSNGYIIDGYITIPADGIYYV